MSMPPTVPTGRARHQVTSARAGRRGRRCGGARSTGTGRTGPCGPPACRPRPRPPRRRRRCRRRAGSARARRRAPSTVAWNIAGVGLADADVTRVGDDLDRHARPLPHLQPLVATQVVGDRAVAVRRDRQPEPGGREGGHAQPSPGTGWHQTGVRSTAASASWASCRAPGRARPPPSRKPSEVVGEVLGVGRGSVHRRHRQVVAHAEAPIGRRRAAPVSTPSQRAVVGHDQHTPHIEADRIEARAIRCRGYGATASTSASCWPAATSPASDPIARQMVNFVYLIGDRETGEAVVIDPAYDIQGLLDVLDADGMRLTGALATHYHPDHVGGSMMGHADRGDRGAAGTGAGADPRAGRRGAVGARGSPRSPRPTSSPTRAATWSWSATSRSSSSTRRATRPAASASSSTAAWSAATPSSSRAAAAPTSPAATPPRSTAASPSKLAKVPDDAVLFPGHLYSAEPSASMADTRRWNYVFKPSSEAEWLAMFGQ